MEHGTSSTPRSCAKRTDHPDTHYSVKELATFLGVTENTILQRVQRLSRRTFVTKRGNTRKPILWASLDAKLLNDTAAKRLLRQRRDNFRSIPTTVRPINSLSYKQVHAMGLSDKRLFDLVQNDRIETHYYKGRYMFNADDIAAVTAKLPKTAPRDMVPLHRLKHARGCSKQAIYAWADRHPGNQGIYRAETGVACIRHITIEAAYSYLTQAFGSPSKALERVKRLGMKYYRQIRPACIRIDLKLQHNRPPAQHGLPEGMPDASDSNAQVFRPQYGHDLISLAT